MHWWMCSIQRQVAFLLLPFKLYGASFREGASISSLEAKHLILEWIMKVKGPKNQADFIEVLYVVVNAWGAIFWNTWEYG